MYMKKLLNLITRTMEDAFDDLGYEKVPQNQRAVRILGYNGIEITPENIDVQTKVRL